MRLVRLAQIFERLIISTGLKKGRLSSTELLALLKYPSLTKWRNAIFNELEYRLKRTKLSSFPPVINVSTSTSCNLKCTYCPTGQGIKQGRKDKFISLGLVKKAMDEMGDYLVLARLYTYGEPLLVKALPEIVAEAHRKRVYTLISSNMNYFNVDLARRTLAAGLDHIIVAIDGATAETYRKYRVNGDFNKVVENTKKLIELKREMKRDDLVIEWQFVPFKFNEHEVAAARRLSEELGCDLFTIYPAFVEDEKDLPENENYNVGIGAITRVVKCNRPWTNFVLQTDGGVGTCAHSLKKEDDLDDYSHSTFKEIWQEGKAMTYIRKRLTGEEKIARRETICEKYCFSRDGFESKAQRVDNGVEGSQRTVPVIVKRPSVKTDAVSLIK